METFSAAARRLGIDRSLVTYLVEAEGIVHFRVGNSRVLDHEGMHRLLEANQRYQNRFRRPRRYRRRRAAALE